MKAPYFLHELHYACVTCLYKKNSIRHTRGVNEASYSDATTPPFPVEFKVI